MELDIYDNLPCPMWTNLEKSPEAKVQKKDQPENWTPCKEGSRGSQNLLQRSI